MDKTSMVYGVLLGFILIAGIYLADVSNRETIEFIELGIVEAVDYERQSNGLDVSHVVAKGGEFVVRGTFPHLKERETVLKLSRNKNLTLCYLDSEVCGRLVN